MKLATLTFSAPDSPLTKSYEVSELVELNDLVEGIGENNDRFHALAIKKSDMCQGTIQGQWIKMTDEYGVFKGVVVASNGMPVGHIRGFFGGGKEQNKLVAKMISRDGIFGGILKGTYEENNFASKSTMQREAKLVQLMEVLYYHQKMVRWELSLETTNLIVQMILKTSK